MYNNMPSTVDYKILEETIDKMKAKYVPVVKELCLEHLQTFDKSRYIEQIAAEMSEILPDLDVQKVESAALCVSNAMNSEARSVCGRRKTDAVASKENCSHCVQVRSDPDTVCDSENVMPSSQNSSNWSTLLIGRDIKLDIFSFAAGFNIH